MLSERRLWVVILLMTRLQSGCADTDTPTVKLPAVTVTGQSEFAPTSSTTFLDHDDLLRSGKREIGEVLRGRPGVALQNGPKGGYNNLYVRGAGGQGLIQIDGIPLFYTIGDAFNLGGLSADAFESADVVRGSAAQLYGSRALGGVIRLSTRDAPQSFGAMKVEGGTFATLRETVASGYAGSQGRISATANRDDLFDGTHWADPRQGNPERDPFHSTLLTLRGNARLNEVVDSDSSLIYANTGVSTDSLGFGHDGRITTVDDRHAWINQENWLAQSTVKGNLHRLWNSRLQLGFTQQRGTSFTNQTPIDYTTRLYLARWENSHPLTDVNAGSPGVTLSWGGEGRYEMGETPTGTSFSGSRTLGSGFTRLEATWGNWVALGSVQVDAYSDYGAHPLFHTGIRWQPNDRLGAHLSGGIGYRPPSFNELLVPIIGNPNLQPEHAGSGELGVDWQANASNRLTATAYYNHYDNLILTTRTPIGLYQSENFPHVRIVGLETQWTTRWTERIQTGLDYTLSFSENLVTHQPLPRHPNNIARAWVSWQGNRMKESAYFH